METKSLTILLANTYNPQTASGQREKPVSEFAGELKALTDDDRQDLALQFAARDQILVEYQISTKEIYIAAPDGNSVKKPK